MSNLDLWEKLGKTDPSHTKDFQRAGGFKGTAIKPMFSYKRLTEVFGPCGKGWGVSSQTFQVINGANEEILIYCTVNGWYFLEGEKYQVVGVGGDKVTSKFKNGNVSNDDEAFKKAFTDAITNAFKMIGVGADVHMGMFDDSKYVNEMRQEFSQPIHEKQNNKPVERRSKDEAARKIYEALQTNIDKLSNFGAATKWGKNNASYIHELPLDWEEHIRARFKEKLEELKQMQEAA